MIRGFLAALAFAACASMAQAQTRPAVTSLGPDYPKAVIFIGNSFFYYNNGMPGHVTLLEKAADPEHKSDYGNTMVTIGDSGFDWHDVDSYFRPNAIGSYRFDENNNVVFGKRDKLFDAAVMMDCSQCPIHPRLKSVFTEYAKKDADIVRAHGKVKYFNATNDQEIEAAFSGMSAEHIGAVIVAGEPFFDSRRAFIVGLAAKFAIPASYGWRENVMLGGLLSCGTSITDSYRNAGLYCGRILKGEKPADLPVMQPTKFELTINLKTAKSLGLNVPAALLTGGDEVIE